MGLYIAVVAIIVLVVTFIAVNRLWCFWSRSKVCLIGKTALVTGGASGIGYEVALALASKGCRVIIGDIVNISEAVQGLIKETHNPHIIGKKVDLRSFKSVREFAKDILATETRLDILLCNAGVGNYTTTTLTEDGLESTMQVNYFSHFLLTHLLLDLLKKSTPSRVIFTSSLMAYVSNLTVDTLNPNQEYLSRLSTRFIGGSYSNSKLSLAAVTNVFGSKLKDTGVTVNAVHPGGVKTSIFAKALKRVPDPLLFLLGAIVFCYGKTPEQGAQTLLHLAQSDEVETITGQSFFEGMRVPRPWRLNNSFCQKIWDKSIEYLKMEPHEIKC